MVSWDTRRDSSWGNVCSSQPDICSGDQSRSSLPATIRCRRRCWLSLQRFGRQALSQAWTSASAARYWSLPPLRAISRLTVDGVFLLITPWHESISSRRFLGISLRAQIMSGPAVSAGVGVDIPHPLSSVRQNGSRMLVQCAANVAQRLSVFPSFPQLDLLPCRKAAVPHVCHCLHSSNQYDHTECCVDRLSSPSSFQETVATTGFNTQISILRANEPLSDEGGNTFITNGSVPIVICWGSDASLQISGVGNTPPIKQNLRVSGVVATYAK